MQLTYLKILDELVDGCVKNDRLSQKRLYERLYGKMMAVCMRYAADRDQATEMLNVGFYKVFDTIGSYQKKENNSVEAWIYRIMVNTAIDHLRREVRHQHTEIGYSVYAEHESDVISDMTVDEIMAMISRLTPAYRAVFNLYVVEGYNHQEIGKLLNISEGTSKSNLAKARLKLQLMFKEMQQEKTSNYGKESQR
jgi:RNA polymerase sigma-70 factor (ECF subfamily)